jgi:tetraacyldisaccharide-1-P 4'-kinase
LGRPPQHVLSFPDHHDFRSSLNELTASKLPIICTEKDAVKLAGLPLPVPCFSLDVQARFFASLSVKDLVTGKPLLPTDGPQADGLPDSP